MCFISPWYGASHFLLSWFHVVAFGAVHYFLFCPFPFFAVAVWSVYVVEYNHINSLWYLLLELQLLCGYLSFRYACERPQLSEPCSPRTGTIYGFKSFALVDLLSLFERCGACRRNLVEYRHCRCVDGRRNRTLSVHQQLTNCCRVIIPLCHKYSSLRL